MAVNGVIVNNTDVQKDNAAAIEILKGKMADLIKETNQFTYIVTHDLQAPLRMISGFLELIEKRYADKLDDTGKQFIDFAMKGSQKMRSLIFDLLEYSRLSSIELEFTQTDLNQILFSVLDELRPVLENTGALVEAGQLPVVNADKRLMTLLFRHILDNAVKFRSEVPPEIKIQAEKHNSFWELSFTDNGIGIDPSFLEKIFVIFRRLHTDELKYPGTGTGLAVCKKIAELHGGAIKANSVPGKGTTIMIQLATE